MSISLQEYNNKESLEIIYTLRRFIVFFFKSSSLINFLKEIYPCVLFDKLITTSNFKEFCVQSKIYVLRDNLKTRITINMYIYFSLYCVESLVRNRMCLLLCCGSLHSVTWRLLFQYFPKSAISVSIAWRGN